MDHGLLLRPHQTTAPRSRVAVHSARMSWARRDAIISRARLIITRKPASVSPSRSLRAWRTPRTIGSARTQMAFNVDLSMEKVFFFEKLCSGIQLEFGLEAQNPFNHPVFGTPDTSVDDPSFGTVTYSQWPKTDEGRYQGVFLTAWITRQIPDRSEFPTLYNAREN
jgi:hypothetical protein